MNKLILVDAEISFLDIIQSITFTEEIDIQVYTTCKDIMEIISRELPDVIFLCLDIVDVDEFILHDVMKKTNSKNKIPLILTYSEKSAEMIKLCKNLRYQPEEYLIKPVSEEKVRNILLKYFNMEENGESKDAKFENIEPLLDESGDNLARTDSLFEELIEQEKESDSGIDRAGGKNKKKGDQGVFIVHDGKIDKAKEEIALLKAEIKRLEGDKENIRVNFTAQNKELLKKITELEQDEKKEEAYKKKEAVYTEKISILTDQIKTNSNEIKELSESEEELQKQLKDKEEEFEKLKKEFEEAKNQLFTINKKNMEKEDELDKIKSVTDEINEYIKKINDLLKIK